VRKLCTGATKPCKGARWSGSTKKSFERNVNTLDFKDVPSRALHSDIA